MTRNICNKNTAKHAIAYLVLLVILLATPSIGLADMHPDYAYATLYPSSMYGVLYRFNEALEEFSEFLPALSIGYLSAENFEMNKYFGFESPFFCVVPFDLWFEIKDTEQKTSDWIYLSLKMNFEDMPTTPDGKIGLALVFCSMIKACDPSMTNTEASSMVSVLLENMYNLFDLEAKNKHQVYNGRSYSIHYAYPGTLTLSILVE